MSTKTAPITDLDEFGDVREQVEDIIRLSDFLLTARKREAEAKDQKTDVWQQIQTELIDLDGDVLLDIGGVRLKWSKAADVEVQVPDDDKIAKLVPGMLKRKAVLEAELANINYEIGQLEKAHTRVSVARRDAKLTVNAAK